MEPNGHNKVAGKRLGLRPRNKSHPVVRLSWARGRPPEIPTARDNFQHWEVKLDGNDRYGDCGPVSVANHRAMATAILTGVAHYPSIDDVFDLYRRSGNPHFNPDTGQDDNGVAMDVLCDAAWSGGIGGTRLIGYAVLADNGDDSVCAAIDLFGGVLFAVDLQTAQSRQTDAGYWDYSPSHQWGGHAIVAASYDRASGKIDVGTWGKRIYTTAKFRQHQLGEVWIPLWPELVTSGRLFDPSVDWQGLVANWQAITKRPFPVPIPVPITPPPVVPPVPPVPPGPAGESPITIYPETREYHVPAGWTARP